MKPQSDRRIAALARIAAVEEFCRRMDVLKGPRKPKKPRPSKAEYSRRYRQKKKASTGG